MFSSVLIIPKQDGVQKVQEDYDKATFFTNTFWSHKLYKTK